MISASLSHLRISSNIFAANYQGGWTCEKICQKVCHISYKYCPKGSNNITTERTTGNAKLCIQVSAENITKSVLS